jgi:predicted component of type VI protein secretion system
MLAKAKIVLDGELQGVATLDGDRVVFGRGAHGPGQITDATASKDHLMIERIGDTLIATDLGSRHGTYINRAPLLQPTRLENGDVLLLGRTELRIEIDVLGDTNPLPSRMPMVTLDDSELRIAKALVAPFRVPGAVAAVPPSNKEIAEAANVPLRTLDRRLDSLAAKLRVPSQKGRGRKLDLARRILEWGVDGQRPTSVVLRPSVGERER